METPEERVTEMEREIVQLREALNRSRMDKELLEWEKSQAEAPKVEQKEDASNPQAKLSTKETPAQTQANPLKFREVDSEIRFKLPRSEYNETGYMSLEPTTQTSQHPNLTTNTKSSMMYSMSTPVAQKIETSSTPTRLMGPHTPFERQSELSPLIDRARAHQHNTPTCTSDVEAPMHHTPYQGVHQRPLLVPDRYNGTASWNEYEQHFEACIGVNGWNDLQAATFLTASLQGSALRAISNVGPGVKNSYRQLRRLLSQRFGPSHQAENYLAELRHRRQGPTESLQELGQAIHELASRAYPDIPPPSRDRLERNHFIDAIESQSIREGIHRARPSSLDDAIHAALETENFEKIELQRRNERLHGRPLKYTRTLDHEDEQRLQKLEKLIGQQAQQMETLTNVFLQNKPETTKEKKASPPNPNTQSSPQAKEPRKCFRCGDTNHLIRDCPVPKQNPQKKGNVSQPTEGSSDRL